MSLKYFHNPKNKHSKSLPESSYFCLLPKNKNKSIETPQCICTKGSFTLEAVIIMPLLACFFSFLLFYFRIMQIQLVVQDALDDTSYQIAVDAAYGDGDKISIEETGIVLAKTAFVSRILENKNLLKYVDGQYLGISLLESTFDTDYIFLKANYRIRYPINLLGRQSFQMTQQSICRKWTGGNQSIRNLEEAEWVYITETGSVYHSAVTCSHLELSIHPVMSSELPGIRNESGEKYQKCLNCVENESLPVYVYTTNYGNHYHTDLNCSGIKRTIYRISITETGAKRKCTKCWN